jgi:hypothetical protein
MTSPWVSALEEDTPITIPCRSCGHKTAKTVGWLQTCPASIICGGCGEKVALDQDNTSGASSKSCPTSDIASSTHSGTFSEP